MKFIDPSGFLRSLSSYINLSSFFTKYIHISVYHTITMCTKSHVMEQFLVGLIFVLLCLNVAECQEQVQYSAINCRKHTALLTDFGGNGDGVTSNTAAFNAAIAHLSTVASDGGAQLVVPPGKWLTGSFNLVSDHFTLYIDKDAVLLASQEESDYPIIEPLPSYGHGRDGGKRFSSLIFGTNLTDIVITGGNGTIDGQGATWWEKFKKKRLENTRPYLIEIMYSNQVQISNLTLTNSPSWHVHPTYSTNVIIESLTIIAPVTVPNTDGINPDSCTNTRIHNNYIVSGDDCVAVKSGWDQYGIQFAMPTQNLSIKGLTCISPKSAVVALGSEMSGGIQNVRVEDITAINSESAVRIKTAIGRGGYVKDIFVRNMNLDSMKYVFWMTGDYGSHPDEGFDPKALPVIDNINYKNVFAKNVTIVGKLAGIEGDSFKGICISNATAEVAVKKVTEMEEMNKKAKLPWNCTDIVGVSSQVTPKPCDLLQEQQVDCAFPEHQLAIDSVVLQTCSLA